MTHTPGPWAWGRDGTTLRSYAEGPSPAPPICRLTDRGSVRDADARLIASAPDLLAVLKAYEGMGSDEVGKFAVAARAAIAKAEREA